MRPRPKFCSRCGAPLETRVRGGRPRDLCSACGTAPYHSPRPAAVCVVLNERREALLVKRKRDPDEEVWSLPMGFVEPEETISAAAVRELKELTGLDARPLHLLDTESCKSDEYGDLLVVTFEMKKVGGAEAPGGEAEALAYFPLSRHPPLVLSSHEKVLRICADAHLEEWAICDSFEHLQSGDTKVMLSDALVALINERAEELAQVWLADVYKNPTTARCRNIDRQELLELATTALSQFSRWLSGDEADREVADFYFQIGRERKAQGFQAQEILSALMLLKKHVWTLARNHGVWGRPIDVYRVLELSRRIAAFFDKVMYHAVRGFEAEAGRR